MLNKIIAVVAVMALIVSVGIVGRMDYQMLQQEQAWQNSVQAIEMEQEKVSNEIMMLKDQFETMGKEVGAQSVLIWDIRERVHLDIGWEIEQEMEEWNR